MGYKAEMILDSVNVQGRRLATMLVHIPTCLLAQFNKHRAFSSNTSSFRAIPTETLCNQVLADPYIPDRFTGRQRGMSGKFMDDEQWQAAMRDDYLEGLEYAVTSAIRYSRNGMSKEDANRILLPYAWSAVLVSGTQPEIGPGAWSNFFAQRLHNGPEDDSMEMQRGMHFVAKSMKECLDRSEPVFVDRGGWHLPFLRRGEGIRGITERLCVSVSRCARISYGTELPEKSVEEEIAMAQRLQRDGHWTPFEHQATPTPNLSGGNFQGWMQQRKICTGEFR